jgi:uncharacterized membrane protein YsdA (DUF1294 family)
LPSPPTPLPEGEGSSKEFVVPTFLITKNLPSPSGRGFGGEGFVTKLLTLSKQKNNIFIKWGFVQFIHSIVLVLNEILAKFSWTHIVLYLMLINVITFFMYRTDKQAAIDKGWRIPEQTLHFAMIIGGTFGAIVAQQRFRHKTKKSSFQIVFRSLILLQLLVIIALLFQDVIFSKR